MDFKQYVEIVGRYPILDIRMKGFWAEKIVDQVGKEFLRLLKQEIGSFGGKPFIALADFTKCKVLPERAKQYIGQGMNWGKQQNLVKGVEIIPGAIARLNVKRAAKKTGKDDFRIVVPTREEAEQVITELKKSLNL